MNTEDAIDFLTAMCETEESARYGHRPRDRAVQEFGDMIAAQARRQFEEGLAVLAQAKRALRTYARSVVMEEVNEAITEGPITQVATRFVGQWEWCIELQRGEGNTAIEFVFGPTAVVEQARVPRPLENPDYSQVFVMLQNGCSDPQQTSPESRIAHTGVHLAEVLEGLPREDVRLRDAVLQILRSPGDQPRESPAKAESPAIPPELVTALVPVLSRSLAEQFNVFRVMHHGTHEKQLSNVFAWLLDEHGTHELGDAPQRIFLELVNAKLPEDAHLPLTGYTVAQEVVTPGDEDKSGSAADISDILLSSPEAAVVVENFGTSDGHGHDFRRYLALGTAGDRAAAVVLLCERHTPHLQRDGWEQAVVVTYAEMLNAFRAHITADRRWTREHPDQRFFIRQLYEHFVEGPATTNTGDTLDFLVTMCESGESARYGHRPRKRAVQEFGDLIAAQAREQFEEGLSVLGRTKRALRTFARAVLIEQVNAVTTEGPITKVTTRFVGQYEWCVELQRGEGYMAIELLFGPSAVVLQERVPRPMENPDYSQLFMRLQIEGFDLPASEQISDMAYTGVSLAEVLEGLPRDDVRLRDAVLQIVAKQQPQGC